MNRASGAISLFLLACALPAPAQPFGRYLSLDGGTAYLKAGSAVAAQPSGAMTLEAWIRITEPSTAGQEDCRTLLGKNWRQSYWVGYCYGGAAPVLRSYTAGYSPGGGAAYSAFDAGVLPIGTWAHVAVTTDGSTRKHYVNGLLVGTRTGDVAPRSSATELQIGSDQEWGYRPDAEIDEVRIWSVARTQAEILAGMKAPVPTAQTGLLSVFPLDGSGEDLVGDADAAAAGGTVSWRSSLPFAGFVRFDGGPGRLEASSSSAGQPTTALTFETWLRVTQPIPPTGTDCRSLFGKDYTQAYWVGLCRAGGGLALRSYTSGGGSARDLGTIPVGPWVHVAVTSDGATRSHYVDGKLVGSAAESGPPTSSAVPLRIGSDASWNYPPWAEMDELRIWGVARSQSEILSTKNAPLAARTGLLSAFPFEGSGEDVVGAADTAAAGGAVTFVAANPESSRTFFIPVVLKNQYSSEITFTNRGSTTATVVLSYTAAQGGGSGTAASFTLAPGRQRVEPDATALLRSLGLPLATDGTLLGTLRATFSRLSSPEAGAVTVRTGTDTSAPTGRAGLAYAGVPVERTFATPVAIAGLRFGASSVRTNLAIQNAGAAGDGDVTLRVTLFEADGSTHLVLPDTVLPPGGFRQFSPAEMGLPEGFLGSARVERVSSGGRFYAYAVQNDQTNSDGSFVPAVVPGTATAQTLTAPAIVEAGTFSSELFVTNVGGETRNVVATLSCQGCPADASFGFLLGPNETVRYSDLPGLLRSSFAIPSPMGVGQLTLSGQSGSSVENVVATVRTSSVVGEQGAFGVAYPGLRGTEAAVSSAWVCAMQQNAATRSNLAFLNLGSAGADPIALRLEIFDGDTGRQVAVVDDERLAAIPPSGFVQVSSFLPALAPGVSNAWVRVTRTSGTNPFLAYGVVNDGGNPGERTGDGAFVAMDVP
jgi:hypothetical protein